MLLIKNGEIHDAVNRESYMGDICVEDGKIKWIVPTDGAHGYSLATSEAGEGVEVIDARGLQIYPGFVEAHGHIGLDGYGIGYEGMDYNEMNDIVSPQMRGIDGVKPLDPAFAMAAAAGVTSVCVGPGSANVLGGTFTTIKTVGKRVEDMVIRDGVAMKCAFGENPKRVYRDKKDSSRMTTAAILRETLFKAREYMEKKEAAGEDIFKRPAFDMKLEALPQTNHIKAIVTAELPMDLEKKGRQSYQGQLYVRFIGLGNGTLHSLYDRSVGFFRRQIILTAKERPANRVDDPFIAEKMCGEAEGIFLWALEGLRRLIVNNYRFTISQQAQENMKAAVADGNNIVEFMQSTGYIAFQPDAASSSKDLYAAYKLWCEDNAYNALSMKSFCNYLTQNAGSYGISHTNNIYIGNGRRSRGFTGLQVLIPHF